ncbi:MAG: DUF541 domain-containing protein [Hymenobacter sp.]|nr:MAG: DUF541 domain-containing protein [Hymenobacter sp.]
MTPIRLLPLLLVPLAGPVLAQTAPALPLPLGPHTVLVRGTAERELDPEKLDVLLTYRFSDNVKESERTQNQEASLRQVLSQAGIAESKLVLEDLSASGYGGFSKVANTTVTLTKVYRLTLDNPRQLGTLVPQLVQTGADNLRFVNLQNAQLATTRAEVAGQAVADARQKALLAAKAAGSQLGGAIRVLEILPGGPERLDELTGAGYVSGNAYKKARSSDGPVEIDTPSLRKIKLTATYDVLFELRP